MLCNKLFSALRVRSVGKNLVSLARNVQTPRLLSTQVDAALSEKFTYTLDNGSLDETQRRFYEENGFIVIRNLVSKKKLEAYEKRFRDIANGVVKVQGLVVQKDVSFVDQPRNENTVYKLQDLFLDKELFDYCIHDKIMDYAENVCGKNMMAVHTMLINKPPDSGTKSSRHPLHQDLLYFPFRPANKVICAWTAMEAVTRENGCLVALPGSHKGELLEHGYPDWDGQVNKMYHGITDISNKDSRVYLEMGPGDTVLFHPLLIHGSGANMTKGYRKAISCHYAAAECEYIDVKGTKQEKLSEEILALAKKMFGVEVDDYAMIWRFRSQLVRGDRINM